MSTLRQHIGRKSSWVIASDLRVALDTQIDELDTKASFISLLQHLLHDFAEIFQQEIHREQLDLPPPAPVSPSNGGGM